ncbi:MAG: YncE family protein, partial [Thermoplasmata archaeon]
ATIPVGNGPEGAVFDSSNDYVYVTNFRSGTISLIYTPLETPTSPSSGKFAGSSFSMVTMELIIATIVVIISIIIVIMFIIYRKKKKPAAGINSKQQISENIKQMPPQNPPT